MTKQQLQEYRWLQKNVQRGEERLLELETRAMKMTRTISDEPKGGTTQDLTDIVAEMIETQEQINRDLVRMYQVLREIEAAIASLPEREKYLIRLKYIDGYSWEKIAVEMNYSWQHVHKIHSKILKSLA